MKTLTRLAPTTTCVSTATMMDPPVSSWSRYKKGPCGLRCASSPKCRAFISRFISWNLHFYRYEPPIPKKYGTCIIQRIWIHLTLFLCDPDPVKMLEYLLLVDNHDSSSTLIRYVQFISFMIHFTIL